MILTPHIGGSTEEAQTDIGRFVAGKLRDYADSGHTTMSVNLPQVQSPATAPIVPGCCTSITTCPGVLATVNGVLADLGSTSRARCWSTRGDLGYVITDIAGAPTPEVVDKLASLPETVRLRALD